MDDIEEAAKNNGLMGSGGALYAKEKGFKEAKEEENNSFSSSNNSKDSKKSPSSNSNSKYSGYSSSSSKSKNSKNDNSHSSSHSPSNSNEKEFFNLIDRGNNNRAVAETNMNATYYENFTLWLHNFDYIFLNILLNF